MNTEPEHDGCYHPTCDDEITYLVRRASVERRTLRVRGDGHSVAHAIYADPLDAVPNTVKAPPPAAGPNFTVVLDRYGPGGIPGYCVRSREQRVIEVDGGMVLGSARDGSGRRGLLEQLTADEGWMLASTGGIAHQTVAGFIATASAGGSLQTSVSELVCGVTVIDGTGEPMPIDEGDPDFWAVIPHLGLLGVVTKVRLRCIDAFGVRGTQRTTVPQEAVVDLFGPGGTSGDVVQKSLANFLVDNEYARIEWWPQEGAERVRVWTGRQDSPPATESDRVPFHMFQNHDQLLGAIALTAIGNRHNLVRLGHQLEAVLGYAANRERTLAGNGDVGAVKGVVSDLRAMGAVGSWIASLVEDITHRRERLTSASLDITDDLLRTFLPRLLDRFTPLSDDVPFYDHAWRVLPMDDEVDDVYLPIEFTEIWVPLKQASDAMQALKSYFAEPGQDSLPFARTGTFEFELYATKASSFWLHPACADDADGTDDWSDGVLRINPYWYARNLGDPAQTFFPQFWKLLREQHIPYRLHWGKFLPRVEDNSGWPAYIQEQYPKQLWDDFMAARRRHDPDDIFINEYWRAHLGLSRSTSAVTPYAVPRGQRGRIADIHCHYPMHVLADRSRAAVALRKLCTGRRLPLDATRCVLMKVFSRFVNSEHWWTSWRVTFEELQAGHAGLVLSVHYDPVYEVLVVPRRQRPRPTAFDALICEIKGVECDLYRHDPAGSQHSVVTTKRCFDEALAAGRMTFVHAVEGGLFLGDSPDAITANVATLAERGVAYVTLAHLFYRGIASNVGALPKPVNTYYDCMFHQRERGLSTLGRAAVEAMYAHHMLIDVTHMDGAALNATFERLNELDEYTGAKPEEHPVIVSHGGYRFGNYLYMLDKTTILEIKRRNGVIGLILARDEIEDGLDVTSRNERFYALRKHIDKIREITGSYDHLCIGSDLDGYTKPTVLERWAHFTGLEDWLRRVYPHDDADKILFRNAERVVRTALR